MSGICVIVPAYNEEESIQKVIKQIKKVSKKYSLVVINDGSIDETSRKAKALGVPVIDLPFNTGIGGAMQAGFKYALQNNCSVAIQVDGDGQHPPEDIPKLLKHLNNKVDLIIGSRFIKKTKYKTPLSRKGGIQLLTWLINLLYGRKIYDPTSGFRVYSNKALRLLAKSYPIDFPEPQSLVEMLKRKFVVKEVSVHMNARVTGQSSIIHAKAIYLYIAILLGIILTAFKKQSWYESA